MRRNQAFFLKSGPCPCFNVGDEFILKRTPTQDDFYHLMNGKFCGEAWDAVSRYVYTALQGGSIMQGWINDITSKVVPADKLSVPYMAATVYCENDCHGAVTNVDGSVVAFSKDIWYDTASFCVL